LVAQLWAFANDIYTEQQGKRLFAIIGIGSALGAILGSRIAGLLFEPIGAFSMMLVAAGLLGVCMILTNWVHQREGVAGLRARAVQAPVGSSGGFKLILGSRYLLLIAMMVLLANLVNTTGEFILGKTVEGLAEQSSNPEAYIGEFYSGFFFWVNLASAVLQMFVVSRLLNSVGVGSALFVLPLIALGSYSLLAFVPVLSFIRVAKIAENSVDYSIQNTARHALFLNTSRDAKYKAQSATEGFFWRAGDALSALLVFVGTLLVFNVSDFAIANLIFVGIWLGVAAALARRTKQGPEAVEETRSAA
jgi:AAA family ATP:ADP antiporter